MWIQFSSSKNREVFLSILSHFMYSSARKKRYNVTIPVRGTIVDEFFPSLAYTQGNFPWTDFSLSCELPCATNGFKTKEIFLSEENFPVYKRAFRHIYP